MAIGDLTALPVGLANAIQQGMLARKFKNALRTTIAYSKEASYESVPAHIGSTYTFTRMSELPVSAVALDPTLITNLDDGLSTDAAVDEQFQFKLSRYARTYDVDLLTQKATIEDYFMRIVGMQGRQAARTREAIARTRLLNAYMGGQSQVIAGTNTTSSCHLDDIRGFMQVMLNGTFQTVSTGAGYMLSVSDLTNPAITLQVTGFTVDGTNISSAISVGGVSGYINYVTVSTAPSVGDVLQAGNACPILRPNGKASTQQLASTDSLTTILIMQAKQRLASNGVEPYEDGFYRAILSPTSMTQLYSDPDFKIAYQGRPDTEPMRDGRIIRHQGVEFIESTEALVQGSGAGTSGNSNLVTPNVNRVLLLGKGALIRGDFDGLDEFTREQQKASSTHDMQMIDGTQFAIRSPLDRLGEIVASSWQWIGDYCTPSDATTTSATVGTANSATFKRAQLIEHAA